jgi:hypothetical protein
MKTSTINDALRLAGLLRPSWPAISARIAASGVPTCEVAEASLKEKLKQVERELSEGREERAVFLRERDAARAAFAQSSESDPNSAVFKRAERAVKDLADCDKRLQELQTVQVGTLKMLGRDGRVGSDQNGPRLGEGGANVWRRAARELDMANGKMRFDARGDDFLKQPYAAGFGVSPAEGLTQPAYMAPFIPEARDLRFLYPAFTRTPLDEHELAIWDFKQTGGRTVEGEVERDPVSTSEKATLALHVTLETPSLKSFAVVIDGIPIKLLEAEEALGAFLTDEMSYQVSLAVDRHCLAAVAAAKPAHGKSGATLIEQTRNAVSAMRAEGALPTILALKPTDAAALDVQKTGTAGLEQYIFGSKDTGSASPLFGLTILELPHIEAPLLVDPLIAGVFYSAPGHLLVDPYSEMSKNEVRLRWEADGLLHIRDAAGFYEIKT